MCEATVKCNMKREESTKERTAAGTIFFSIQNFLDILSPGKLDMVDERIGRILLKCGEHWR